MRVIDVYDPLFAEPGAAIGELSYEDFLATGSEDHVWRSPDDEWEAIALNYTSGTTGNPKGVVYSPSGRLHQRGVERAGLGDAASPGLPVDAADVPLQWLVLSVDDCGDGGHARLPAAVSTRRAVFDAIREHGVTHYCGAPIVHALLVNAPDEMKQGIEHRVSAMVAAAAPPAAMIEGMDRLGFDLTHVYGLTEVYGPAAVCAKQPDWASYDIGERARLNGRQGVRYTLAGGRGGASIRDTMKPVPWDGATMGEGDVPRQHRDKGYLKNERGDP